MFRSIFPAGVMVDFSVFWFMAPFIIATFLMFAAGVFSDLFTRKHPVCRACGRFFRDAVELKRHLRRFRHIALPGRRKRTV